LNLAFVPQEYLRGERGVKCIEIGMRGVDYRTIDRIDGYNYVPTYGNYVDCSLLMIACYLENTVMAKYWIEECGADPNIRNSTGKSALLMALQYGRKDTVSYLLGCDKVDIGIPEAAALQRKDVLPGLIAEYDLLPVEDKIFGLSGAEVAYIYSGLSGDMTWVRELREHVQDPNVGAECEVGNVLMAAVLSGEVGLVEELLEEGVVKYETMYNHDHILFYALPHVDMLEYLIGKLEELELEELSLSSIEGRWRNNLLERALMMRCEESTKLLLDREPVERWTAASNTLPLQQSLQTYNRPDINNRLLDSCISPWWVIKCALQAANNGDVDLVRRLVEEKGCELSQTFDNNTTVTILEGAAYSGSLALVNYIVEKEPYISSFRHKNGYNHVVAAIQCDGVDLFTLLLQQFPDLLYSKVWNNQSLIMVAASHLAVGVVGVLLSPDFYKSHYKEGQIFDINHVCENKRSALWYAVQSGCVEIARIILNLHQEHDISIKVLDDAEKVNDLFIVASKSIRAIELHDCLTSFGLSLSGTPTSSLSLAAAESASLFSLADKTYLKVLMDMDRQCSICPEDDALLSAVIENAPVWAVEEGCLSEIVRSCFMESAILESEDVFKKALKLCNRDTISFFKQYTSYAASGGDTAQLILDALEGSDMSSSKKKNKIPQFSLTRRRTRCIRWLIQTVKQTNTTPATKSHAVMKALLSADINISQLLQDLLSSHVVVPLEELLRDELLDLLRVALKYCQAENAKLIVGAMNTKGISLTDAAVMEKEGEEPSPIVLALLKDNKDVPDVRNQERPVLIKWLIDECFVDPSKCGNKQMHPTMFAAKIGEYKVFKLLRDLTHVSPIIEDSDGYNLIYHMVDGGDLAIVQHFSNKQLLEKICGRTGEMPIHVAASNGNIALLRYMVEFMEVDLLAKDSEQRTVFAYSELRGNNECIEYEKMLLSTLLRKLDLDPVDVVDPKKTNSATQASRLTVNGWLKEISNAVGKNISLNTSGICAFVYEEYTIVIEVRNDFAYLYALFDVKRFAIGYDSWKALLTYIRAEINPIFYFAMDTNISPAASEGDIQSNDLVAGVNRRVEEMDSQSFRDLLETFIEVVLKAGERLDICAAKRYLRTQLARHRRLSSPEGGKEAGLVGSTAPSEETKETASQTSAASANSVFEKLSLEFQQMVIKSEEMRQVNAIVDNIESFLLDKPAPKDPMSSEEMSTFRTLLDDQFSRLNIQIQRSMQTNETGVVAFTYEDLTIVLEPVSPKLFGVSATVYTGRVGHKMRKNALLMNYLGQYTRGGAIKEMQSATNNRGESDIMFFHHDRVDLNFREFRNILENFIDTALNIKKELSTYHDTLYKDAESRRIDGDLLNRGKAILGELSEGNESILTRIFTVKNSEKVLVHLDSLGNLVANTGKSELWYNVASLILKYTTNFCNAQQSTTDASFLISVQAQVFQSCLKNKFFDEKFIVLCLDDSFESTEVLNKFIQKVFHTREMLEIGKMHQTLSNIISVTKELCSKNDRAVPEIETKGFDEYCEYILLYARDQQHAKEAILCLDWIFDKKPIEPTQNSALLLQTATTHNPKEIWSWLIRRMKPILTEDHFKYILQQNYVDSRNYEKMNGDSIAIIEGIINRMQVQKDHDEKLHSEGPQFYINEVFSSLQWNGNNVWEATSGDGAALSLVEVAIKILTGDFSQHQASASRYRIPAKRIISACKEEGALKKLCEECSGPGESNLLHIAASKDSEAALSLCKFLVETINVDFDNILDGNGRSARTIATANLSKDMQMWARSVGCFLGRYSIDKMVHKSATCTVYFATDEWELKKKDDAKVAIKILTKEKHFQSELQSRIQSASVAVGSDSEKSSEIDKCLDALLNAILSEKC